MSAVSSPRLWNKFFCMCLFNNLFIFVFYFAQTTLLPIYILQKLGANVTQAGLAMTIFMLSSILVRPFTGLMIERFGVKKTFWVSEIFFCGMSFFYLLADNLHVLLIIRFMHGIWFSILTTVCVPIVNQFIPEQRKGEGMGYFVMSINLGLVLGPLLALTAYQSLGYMQVSFMLSAILCLGLMASLPIPFKAATAPLVKAKKTLKLDDFVEKRAVKVSFMVMMTALAYASIMAFISVYAASKHLLDQVSLFFLVFAIAMMSVRPFTGPLYDRKGPNAVVYPAVVLFALGLMTLSQINSVWGLSLAAVLIGIGFGSLQPCLQTLAIQRAPKHRIGHTTSTFFTFYDTGIAIGSICLGVVVGAFGFEVMYMGCAILTLVSLFFYKYVVNQSPIRL